VLTRTGGVHVKTGQRFDTAVNRQVVVGPTRSRPGPRPVQADCANHDRPNMGALL
jgi:hypothetical protein